MEDSKRFVGHSPRFSIDEALHDAVQEARSTMPDAMVSFEVVSIRGRLGGIGAVRDVWVEVRVGPPAEDQDEPNYTTMAVGEEGGEEDTGQFSTMVLPDEENPHPEGDEVSEEADTGHYTTLRVGEEGGESS